MSTDLDYCDQYFRDSSLFYLDLAYTELVRNNFESAQRAFQDAMTPNYLTTEETQAFRECLEYARQNKK